MSSKKTTIDEGFSERLRTLIEEKLKITQGEFAKKIGITSGYVSMVVTGKRGPSAELIAGVFINYSEYLSWLLNQPDAEELKQSKNKVRLNIIEELEQWISEEIRNNPKKRDWFEIQLQESFLGFKKWKEEKKEAERATATFPTSKVA